MWRQVKKQLREKMYLMHKWFCKHKHLSLHLYFMFWYFLKQTNKHTFIPHMRTHWLSFLILNILWNLQLPGSLPDSLDPSECLWSMWNTLQFLWNHTRLTTFAASGWPAAQPHRHQWKWDEVNTQKQINFLLWEPTDGYTSHTSHQCRMSSLTPHHPFLFCLIFFLNSPQFSSYMRLLK